MHIPKKKLKTFTVNDLDNLQKEFYRMYDPDYWLYRIMLLKNSHDDFDQLKSSLIKNTEETIDGDFKRTIRTELHFLYFQMIETLFEIIFAISKHDNRDLWVALTFSNDRNTPFYSETYKRIEKITNSSEIFTEKIKTEIEGKKIEIPLLRWIFYFIYSTRLNDGEWKKNLENIKKLLLIFAHDFTDRGEYNAYKHSLRFYNAPFAIAIGLTGSKKMHSLGSSEDCITFLEEQKKKNGEGKMVPTGRILRAQKPFDFQRDYEECILVYVMIKTIIDTRRHTLLEEKIGEKFSLGNFLNVDFSKLYTPSVRRASFTV
ncbi:MAG: hypothetical protein ACKKMW_02530 [Candidatus Nealsonbacteria bacterium]